KAAIGVATHVCKSCAKASRENAEPTTSFCAAPQTAYAAARNGSIPCARRFDVCTKRIVPNAFDRFLYLSFAYLHRRRPPSGELRLGSPPARRSAHAAPTHIRTELRMPRGF